MTNSLSSRRGWLKAAGGVAAGAALGGFGLLPRRAGAATTIMPISAFLAAQGKTFGQVPPAPNFLDFFSRLAALQNAPTPAPLVATVDYAGLANQFFNFGTTIDDQNSKVIVQPLSDGTVSVRVLLYTHNANTWVIELTNVVNGQLPSDFGHQLLTNPVLFGFRPSPAGAPPVGVALGDSFLDITYITTPDNILVDLITFTTQQPVATLKFVGFRAQATGPVSSSFSSIAGVPSGTKGLCTVSQTGLTVTSNSNSRVFLDGFPAEIIDLHALGT